jgi:hypothetical protein
MKETVVRFGNPLAEKIMRQMAIVTDCHVMMAALLP